MNFQFMLPSFYKQRLEVVWHRLDCCHRMTVEVGCRIYNISILQESLQFLEQPFLFRDVAYNMQLVVLRLQLQLLPYVEQEVERVVGA